MTTFLSFMAVGNGATKAALLTPGMLRRVTVASLRNAPVPPQEITPSASPSLTNSTALNMELSFKRSASKTPASAGTTSRASTILQSLSSANSSFFPTRRNSTLPGCLFWKIRTPSRVALLPRSPPIMSIASLIIKISFYWAKGIITHKRSLYRPLL